MTFRTACIKAVDPIGYLELRCPKAARKKRVQKKWRRRFGPRIPEILEDLLKNKNSFLNQLSTIGETEWKGARIPLPLSEF